MNQIKKISEHFLSPADLAAVLQISERTLSRWAQLGEGPPRTKIGRRVLYRRTAFNEWLVAQETDHACVQYEELRAGIRESIGSEPGSTER